MASGGRWIAVGSAVLGVGALLSISWLVYVRQSHTTFWSWPGIVGVVIGGIGVIMLAAGFMMPEEEVQKEQIQIQRSGSKSKNIQAGRDIRFGDGKRRKR